MGKGASDGNPNKNPLKVGTFIYFSHCYPCTVAKSKFHETRPLEFAGSTVRKVNELWSGEDEDGTCYVKK